MKTILLHIGHHKTGSSAIQACLAKNVKVLNEVGIDYPYRRSFEWATKGHQSSGNLDASSDWLTKQVLPRVNDSKLDTVLFSNENIIKIILPTLAEIQQLEGKHAFKILMFVRNPIELLRSSYNQACKIHGFYGSLREFQPKMRTMQRAEEVIRRCKDLNIDIKVKNYSCCKDRLIDAFSQMLYPDGNLKLAYDLPKRVNRSLSSFELELQRKINEFSGNRISRGIAFHLVNELPDIAAEQLYVNEETKKDLIATHAGSVQYINQFLSADEQLTFEDQGSPEFRTSDEHVVSSKQMSVIAEYIAEQFDRLQHNNANETVLKVRGKRIFVLDLQKLRNSIAKRLKWTRLLSN